MPRYKAASDPVPRQTFPTGPRGNAIHPRKRGERSRESPAGAPVPALSKEIALCRVLSSVPPAMKTPVLACGLIGWLTALSGAEGNIPKFGGEQIGVPPLSLSESIRQRSIMPRGHSFGSTLPRSTDGLPTPLAPNLIPRAFPTLEERAARASRPTPRVTRESGMPVVVPDDRVVYSMRVTPPDPSIDHKIIVVNPSPNSPSPQRRVK